MKRRLVKSACWLGGLLLTALVAACGGAAPTPNAPPAETAPASATETCTEPLVAYCKGREAACALTYDVALTQLRASVAKGDTRVGQIGTCGEYRYLTEISMGAGTSYFDKSGALAGGTSMGDVPSKRCGTDAFSSGYGLVPKCKRQQIEEIKAP